MTAMNSQPCTLRPSTENGPMVYHGSQNETRRTTVAGPKIHSRRLRFRVPSRCRARRVGLGVGRGKTVGLMAAPQFGHSAVPGNTSTRQREQAGTLSTLTEKA